MWTPKRILILLAGMTVFLSGYGVYAYFLGGIDGLPPLPQEYLPGDRPITEPPRRGLQIDEKLTKAFGPYCPELKRAIKLDLASKGWGLAADTFDPLPDGRVKLTPFSCFIMPKKQGSDKFPEINTLRCDEAYLTLDRPISNTAELGNRKVVGVELKCKPDNKLGIVVKNNRYTPEENDDVELFIDPNSPVFFDEKRNLIWTGGIVKLLDKQSRPHPTNISSRGLELYLAKDSKDPRKQPQGKAANKGGGLTGVEKLVLRSNVDMHLWVDSSSGFLGNDSPKKNRPEPEKAHLFVKTNGTFVYEVRSDKAIFESPPLNPKAATPDEVLVMREHRIGEGKVKRDPTLQNEPLPTLYDQLTCHRLELQFRRKPVDKSAPADAKDNRGGGQGIDKEIESARATALPGKEIKLTMDTEQLEALGSELTYYSPTASSGPQTIIKGEPLKAIKEGHIITAKELLLVGANQDGKGQRAFAKGPGQIDMYDKAKSTPDRPLYPWHAFWKDTLTSTKDEVSGKVYDLITLSGDAAFVDDEQQQQLHGQKIQVWLQPAGKNDNIARNEDEAKGASQALSGQRPAKIEAFDNVFVISPELKVRKTDHLLVHFDDKGLAREQLPDTAPPALTLPASDPHGKKAVGTAANTATPGSVPPGTASTKQLPDEPRDTRLTDKSGKNRKPIELEARQVVAYVSRLGSRNHIREVVCEGSVVVQQEPAAPKDKGVDIKGEMLNLLHHVQGDTMHVFGDSRRPANLQLGELILIGPKVTINQRENIAEVEGVGAMQMPSNSTFKGEKPSKEGARLTIHWNKNMLFDGKYAHFHGGVVAYQDTASLRCQDLQVTLDRVVSFKDGEKDGQKAKVDIMVCDRKVFVVDEKRDDKGVLTNYQRLEATQVRLDNPVETTNSSGPGRVIFIQKGGDDQALNPALNPAAKPGGQPKLNVKKDQLLWTRIEFSGNMSSSNKDNLRTSRFYDNCEVFHAPGDRPDLEMNPDRPPENGFYLKSEMLSVFTRSEGKGKNTQFMRADRKVFFRTKDFYGRADVVKYNQEREIIIFEGTPGNPATIYQDQGAGREPRQIQGMMILYNRLTGEFSLEGGNNIQ